MVIQFIADQVKVKTGKPDNSAVVEFTVGEYQLDKIKDLVTIVDKNLKVEVSEYDG